MLVQERDDVDQGEILFVITAGSGAVIEKRQGLGVGVDYRNRSQQPLCVLVGFE